MPHPLYTNTFDQNITSDVVAKTGLDWSEIEFLLATQTSNCIKFEMDGQNVMITQVTALLLDQSNKDCFEASFEYEFCGQIMTYKVKLNIQLDEFCDTPTITNVTFEDPNFTITGSITSDVWLEYSTNGGTSWTRLSSSFPAGATITTSDLPTEVDLKIRLVALCDETKISNIFDYVANSVIFSSWFTKTLNDSIDSTTGTVTITGSPATFKAQAILDSGSETSVTITINGATKGLTQTQIGTKNSTTFTLSAGTYTYSVDITVNGTGSGGIVFTQ